MKLSTHRFTQFLKNPHSDILGALFFGPDRGLIQEQAQKLIKAWEIPLEDPFSISAFSEAFLKANPHYFADEMMAVSLTATKRLVRITNAGEYTAHIVRNYFQSLHTKHVSEDNSTQSNNKKTPFLQDRPYAHLLIEAGECTPRSLLRQFFESEAFLIALGCYHDDRKSLLALIDQELKQKGYVLTDEASSLFLPCLEGDRKQARSELEKLILYAGKRKTITKEDILAISSVSAEVDLQNFLLNVTGNQFERTERELQALLHTKTSPVLILRALQTHLLRLLTIARRLKHGDSAENIMKTLRPPVFIFHRNTFLQQAKTWPISTLENVLQECLTAEIQSKRHAGLEHVILKCLILSFFEKSKHYFQKRNTSYARL